MVTQARTQQRAAPPADAAHLRPPYGAAAVAGLLVFVLYAITLSPTTAFWDTSEYIATAHIVGIPHPPGKPALRGAGAGLVGAAGARSGSRWPCA